MKLAYEKDSVEHLEMWKLWLHAEIASRGWCS